MFVSLLLAISPRNTHRAFEETFFTHAVWGEHGRRQGEARLQTYHRLRRRAIGIHVALSDKSRNQRILHISNRINFFFQESLIV